jgi:cell division transport system permease protein
MNSFQPSAADRRLLSEGRMVGPMPWVIAIMMFLTILAAAAGLAIGTASRTLSKDLDSRVTIQLVQPNSALRDMQAVQILAALRRLSLVKSAQLVSQEELTELLTPWLGKDGLEADLPLPMLIDVELKRTSDADISALREIVAGIATTARIDRQAQWLEPIARLLSSLIWLSVTLVLLMAVATSAAVVLAARGALNTHRATIDVLHLLGATDSQIAGLFQRRIALDALFGGFVGFLLALIILLLVGQRLRDIGSELLGSAGIGWGSWMILFMLPLAGAALSTLSARITVLRALRKML